MAKLEITCLPHCPLYLGVICSAITLDRNNIKKLEKGTEPGNSKQPLELNARLIPKVAWGDSLSCSLHRTTPQELFLIKSHTSFFNLQKR